MQNTVNEICFPAIGKKSPLLNFRTRYLRNAYYITNAVIFIGILLVVGFVRFQHWQYQRKVKMLGTTFGKKVISVTYAQLGPPPSLSGAEVPTSTGARATAPSVGVPKPVPDALAQQETSPNQSEISGSSLLDTTGTGPGGFVVESLPPMDAYIPHEVEPKWLYKPLLEYPEAARSFEYEGSVIIKALLDRDGSVMRIAVMRSSGYPILDSAAVDYIARSKFSPALQHHQPVRVWIGQTITYKLK
jgi:TonB family protein